MAPSHPMTNELDSLPIASRLNRGAIGNQIGGISISHNCKNVKFLTFLYFRKMKITYFKDTDTLLVNFSNREIAITKGLNENVLIELDKDGNVVSMTIEHARKLNWMLAG